jgi:hypothetical protein
VVKEISEQFPLIAFEACFALLNATAWTLLVTQTENLPYREHLGQKIVRRPESEFRPIRASRLLRPVPIAGRFEKLDRFECFVGCLCFDIDLEFRE